MMLNFEFCCYFCLVLVELFRQGILDIPYADVSMVDTIVLMGQFFSGLWAFLVPYNRSGIGSDGYIWKYSLSVNFFSFLSQRNTFWILMVTFHVGSFFAIFTLPGCSSIFCIEFFFCQYYKSWTLIEWINCCVFVVLHLH